MTTAQILAAWVPGLPHILSPERNKSYSALHGAMAELGHEFKKHDVRRILYYSTQWISVLGQSVQAKPRLQGIHVDENWYDLANLPFDFTIDTKLAADMRSDLTQSGYQARAVDYEGFPVDTGTIVADTLMNPNKIPTSMLACCVYSDYNETKSLGSILRQTLLRQEGPSAVVVVSGLSSRYFTTEMDLREDHVRSEADDTANRKLLAAMNQGDWRAVNAMRDDYCKSVKADMGLKALGFLEGMGVAVPGQSLYTKAYGAVYGTGAAVMKNYV